MKLIKLTVLSSLLASALFISCKSDSDIKNLTEFSKSGIVLSGANEVPANLSTASGTMNVFYTRETRLLSYTVEWKDLTDSVLLMHIHGLAPKGFTAGAVQNIIVAATTPGTVGNGLFPQKTAAGKLNFLKSGKISGTLLVDGVVVKETDLLNGMYYMNIHTNGVNPNGGTYSGGEIRGQIVFQ